MRIVQLYLKAFGVFTNTTLDFSTQDTGLHIVYGPNEAGKSTAIRAIEYSLFGIPSSTTYAFLHDYPSMRVGAKLRNESGMEIAFLRRKGKKSTLLELDESVSHPDHALAPFLGNLDIGQFTRVHSIDYGELERGGKEMELLKGLAGESLFAASLGGTRLTEVVSELEDQATTIYGANRRSAIINASFRDYQELVKKKREASVSSPRWQAQYKEYHDTQKRLEHIKSQWSELHTRKTRLQRLRGSLKLLRERCKLKEQLIQIGQVTVLPDDYSIEKRSTTQAKIEALRRQIETLQSRLDAPQGLRHQISQIVIPKGLLENEATIMSLHNELQIVMHAEADRDTKLLAEQQLLSREIETKLVEMGQPTPSSRDFAKRVLPKTRAEFQSLSSEATFHQRLDGLLEEHATLRRRLERLVAEGNCLGPPAEIARVVQQLNELRPLGDIEARIETLRTEIDTLRMHTERELAGWGLWRGNLPALVRLRLPLRETIDRYDRLFSEEDSQLRTLEESRDSLAEDLADVQQQIDRLRQEANIPTEEQLEAARAIRDGSWQQIKLAYAEDREGKSHLELSKLFAEFEQAVHASDAIGDRLRRETERVSQHAERLSRQTMFQSRLQSVNVKISESLERHRKLEAAWREEWNECGICPLSPREMLSWLQEYNDLRQQAIRVEVDLNAIDRLQNQRDQARHSTISLLAALGHPIQEDATLSQVIAIAEQVITQAEECERTRATITRDTNEVRTRLDEIEAARTTINSEQQRWQERWNGVTQQIGSSPDSSPAQVSARLVQIDEVAKLTDKRVVIEDRIFSINQAAAAFDEKSKPLLRLFGALLAEITPRQAIMRLQTELRTALGESTRKQGLIQRAVEAESELQELRTKLTEHEVELSLMCAMAGVQEQTELLEVEQRSNQFTQTRDRLVSVEEQLLELGHGQSVEELATEAEGLDADILATQIQEIERTLETVDQERDTTIARLTELERLCEEADTSSQAAIADQQALGVLSRIHEAAAKYAAIRMAQNVLKREIERFRAENQDPMLAKASDIFSRMTCGEFHELRAEYLDDDRPTIVGVRRHNHELVTIQGMSGGTRDQLYLSLRLAYLYDRKLSEPIPLVIDDILVEFDDDRSLATLEVLTEFSARMQVIFFTHHRHLVELARAGLPAESWTPHLLAPPNQRDTASEVPTKRPPRSKK